MYKDIDEAIKHQMNMAEKYKYQLVLNETGHPMYSLGDREILKIEKYIEEYTQVVEWLEELKAIKESAVFYSNRPIEDIVLEARTDVIEFVVDKIIFPLLNEYDIGMWKNIGYIELAEKWVEFVNARKGKDDDIANDLKNWIRICYSRNSMK